MKIALSLILLVLASSAFAQQETSIDCATYWKIGEVKTYTIFHEKSSPDPNQAIHFIYEAAVSVLDASDTDYIVKWVYHVPPNANAGPLSHADSLPFFEGLQMIFRISTTGSFLELVNWEEVRDSYMKMMGKSAPKNLFSTKEAVESLLIKEIQLYHQPYGYKYTTTKDSSATQLSNPYGGSPLPAAQSYQITAIDGQQDLFTLVIRQYLDKASLNKSQQKKQQLISLDMSDYSEYQFIQSTGWIKHLLYKRKIASDAYTQTESFTIDLKD